MMLRLSDGDYIDTDYICQIHFDAIPDSKDSALHQVAKVTWIYGDTEIFKNNDAITIKDYFDKTHDGNTFLMHELDFAVQTTVLGLALKFIENQDQYDGKEIVKNIVEMASDEVENMFPKKILAFRKFYEDNSSDGISGLIQFVQSLE